MILNCYVDDETLARLQRASKALDCSIEDLAEAVIAEAALNDHKSRGPSDER